MADSDGGSVRRSAILGATSALGQAVGRELAGRGEALVLVGRNATKLSRVAADLTARGASVQVERAAFDEVDGHAALVERLGDIDTYWFFWGKLPDQALCQRDWSAAAEAIHANFSSVASLLTHVAMRLETRGGGDIVVTGSVAGDRGRGSNYVYGSAKGALALFCQGLRNRLAASGVGLLTVKPGFIDTPMTADVPKTPAPLWVTPERVARCMVRARHKGRDICYAPWFWRPIMWIIKRVPERVFKRLSL